MPLHPFVETMFAQLARSGRPPLSAGSPEDARAMVGASRAGLGTGAPVRLVGDLEIPGRTAALPARLYRPHGSERGLAVYLHGGGWVVGELDDYDTMIRTLAARSGCAVLAPAYRLAPEHPFPAALEDAEDAVRWAWANRSALAGVGVPLLLAGDSAGANLATVTAAALRAEVPIAGQLLVYPVTDCDFERPSYRAFSAGMQLTAQDMRWFFSHYAPEERFADARISPLRHPVAPGTPPAVVVSAEYDVLRDEGEAYAEHLRLAGVDVRLHRAESLPHGFIRLHNLVDAADAALSLVANELARLADASRV